MKKRLPVILVIVAIIAIALIYIFTRHTHTFAEATCTTAKICECGEIEGEPLGHTWVDATTENPKTCSFCGLTEGEALKSDPSIPEFNFKQGTVEGYTSETPAEQEVLTGDEISLEDIPDDVQEAMDEIDKALSDTQKPAGVSSYAGTTSKHNWDYPDDYVENGGRFIDRRGDIERKFDKGWIDETDYQERLEDLEQQQGDADDYASTGQGSGSIKGLAESIAKSGQEATGEDGSTIPGGGEGGVTITVKPAKEIVPDGRICY